MEEHMKIACYPGSFDPITIGHIDVIKRARKIFDKVIVLVAENSAKRNTYFFDLNERVNLVKEALKDIDNVEVTSTEGLVVIKARELHAQALIRGLRAVTDYEAEYQMHEVNEYLAPDIDMVYFMAHREQAFVSSTNIKEIFLQGQKIDSLVPSVVLKAMQEKIEKRK